jgi:hypothetical protein
LSTAPWSVCEIFVDPDDCYWAWCKLYEEICDDHAQYKETKIRSVSLPWINPQIRHKMNLRYKCYKKEKRSDDACLWAEYRKLRNEVTFEVRMAKGNYYKSLFDEVKCTRSYWSLIKKATKVKNRNICDIRKLDGSLTNSDKKKAEVLNEYFANVGERLAQNLLQGNQLNVYPVNKVTPTVANIEITQELVCQEISKLKPNKATGPDNISPKLLQLAGETLVPSLTSIFKISAHTNSVPDKWKNANVTAVYKNDDEAEKENYRPISILCIPAKMGVWA